MIACKRLVVLIVLSMFILMLGCSSAFEPEKEIVNSIGMKFVYIQPGTFMVGSPSNEPERFSNEKQHEVTLTKGFYMGTTEVTQKQWRAVMGNNPSHFKGGNLPVELVSWNDCREFIRKLNRQEGGNKYRLPTEAEWEYACRAGTTTPFYFGNTITTDQANYYAYGSGSRIPRKKTTRVGSFLTNDFGLYDMHGNVCEWCQDWYGDYPVSHITDPEGASSGAKRVLRGGAWCLPDEFLRSASRLSGHGPDYRHNGIGFRVVRVN